MSARGRRSALGGHRHRLRRRRGTLAHRLAPTAGGSSSSAGVTISPRASQLGLDQGIRQPQVPLSLDQNNNVEGVERLVRKLEGMLGDLGMHKLRLIDPQQSPRSGQPRRGRRIHISFARQDAVEAAWRVVDTILGDVVPGT